MAWYRDPKRKDKDRDQFRDIPYASLAGTFLKEASQKLVPFLGAGASLPFLPAAPSGPMPVDPALLERLCSDLGITSDVAKLFLEIAVVIGQRLQSQWEQAISVKTWESLKSQEFPPTAAQLAEAFAQLSSYDHFARARRRVVELTGRDDWDNDKLDNVLRAMAGLTGVGSPTPNLLDAASYYQYTQKRGPLRGSLQELFAGKHTPTSTHRLVAQAASNFLRLPSRGVLRDYLIISTNYDGLLEAALDTYAPGPVPYYVLTSGAKVRIRFSQSCQQYLEMDAADLRSIEQEAAELEPRNYNGPRTRPLVAIYKIHGDSAPQATAQDEDTIVITDEDYVAFISRSGGRNAVPANVITMLRDRGLLLLGYSFNDWNVRSLHKTATEYRGNRPKDVGDYAVMTNVSQYETGFFDEKGIDILETPLDLFCQRMQEHA